MDFATGFSGVWVQEFRTPKKPVGKPPEGEENTKSETHAKEVNRSVYARRSTKKKKERARIYPERAINGSDG